LTLIISDLYYYTILHDSKYGRTTNSILTLSQLTRRFAESCQSVEFHLIDNPTFDKHHDLNISISAQISTPNVALDPFSRHSL